MSRSQSHERKATRERLRSWMTQTPRWQYPKLPENLPRMLGPQLPPLFAPYASARYRK